MSLTELSEQLINGELSSLALVQSFLERSAKLNPTLRAFNSLPTETALKAAEASDRRRTQGKSLGPLDGIPIAIKDAIAVKDAPLTCSSKMLANFISPYDAHVITLLKANGAIPFGRAALDEFCMGSSCEYNAFGAVGNPWKQDHVPGGSSGGSAAAVAANMAPAALGSDTGGSIRQPAAFCGLTGLRPTYGRVSRYGLVGFAPSLDQIGPITRTVSDAALLLGAIAGKDSHDMKSLDSPVPDYLKASLAEPEKPLRIGIIEDHMEAEMHPELRAGIHQAIEHYEQAGHKIQNARAPTSFLAIPIYHILSSAEASSNLARFDGIRYGHRSKNAESLSEIYLKSRTEGFGAEVKRRILLGTYTLASGYHADYYNKAQAAREHIREDYRLAFKNCDVLLNPVSPTPAFEQGSYKDNPTDMYLTDLFLINNAIAGLPSISVPCGFDQNGLPLAFQLTGKPLMEAELLQAAHQYQKDHHWHQQSPEINA